MSRLRLAYKVSRMLQYTHEGESLPNALRRVCRGHRTKYNNTDTIISKRSSFLIGPYMHFQHETNVRR